MLKHKFSNYTPGCNRAQTSDVSARYQMAFDLSVDRCRLLDSVRLERRLNSSRRQPAQIVLLAFGSGRLSVVYPLKSFSIWSIKKYRGPKADMKRVLAIKTPIGGVVHIIPRENSSRAVGLTWKERNLAEAAKEASRQYLLDEGFIELAVGIIEVEADVEQFLREIPDIA